MATILRATNEDGVKYDLDVFAGEDFKLDISAIESGDIGKVFGVSSQTISLPPSKTNHEFFGNLYDLGATPATSFTKTVPCQVLQNGTEVFTGKMYLQDVMTDNQGDIVYNVVVVNETVDFKFLIQDLTFADLDFSALDHDYTYGNITSSWDGDLKTGSVFYPLVNYGFDSENPLDTQIAGTGKVRTFTNYNSPIRVDDFKPAIRLRSCLDAIFDKVGYEYTSSLFTSGAYTDDIYMLATKDDRKGITDVSPVSQSFRAYTTASQDYPAPTINSQVYFPAETYDNAGNYSNPTFTAGTDGVYQFEINLVFSITGYSAINDGRTVDVKVFKNGTQIDLYQYDLTGTVSGQMNTVTQGYNLTTGDDIDIRVSFVKSGAGSETLRIIASNNCRFKLIQGPTSLVGGTTNIAENYANIRVLDFLQGIIEKFNLVIEPDYLKRNVLKIETFNTWVDTGEVKDWTDKVDYSQKWKITHPLQEQPRNIKFTDVEDDIGLLQYHKRTFNKIYGEFDYKSSSDIADGERVIGKFFAPTPIKGIEGAPMTILPALAAKEAAEPFTRIEFAPRLLFKKPTRQNILGAVGKNSSNQFVSNTYYFIDENGVTHAESDYGLAHHLQTVPANFDSTLDLHFGNTVSPGHWPYAQNQFQSKTKRSAFTEYWAFYINELYDVDARLLTCNVFLSPSDVQKISLNDKYFIDGQYYRINKINGANISSQDSVEVQLIRTSPRKTYFPRRRYDDGSGTPIDIYLDWDFQGQDGFGRYSNWNTGNVYTGSEAVNRAAALDEVSVFGTSVVWDTQKPKEITFTSQTNLGLNRVDASADIIDVRGDNNYVANNVATARVEGSNNTIESYASFVQVTGTNNSVKASVANSTIQNSTTSSIENSELATIIAGDDTHITGSNGSLAIGQDLTIKGGSQNIVIGNIDGNQKNITDLTNIVAINTNRDLESIENSGSYDYNGIAYLGTTKYVGATYRDYFTITGSAGGSINLDAEPYQQAHYIYLTWSGSNGTYTINLPDTSDTIPLQRGGNGFGRELRFFTDNTLVNNSTIFRLQPSGSDVIDGALYNESVKRPLDGIMIFGTPGQWFVIQRKSKA